MGQATNIELGRYINPKITLEQRLCKECESRAVEDEKVQVGKDQEKAQSEKDSHSKNRGGKKQNQQSGTYTSKTFRKPNEQLFSQ